MIFIVDWVEKNIASKLEDDKKKVKEAMKTTLHAAYEGKANKIIALTAVIGEVIPPKDRNECPGMCKSLSRILLSCAKVYPGYY